MGQPISPFIQILCKKAHGEGIPHGGSTAVGGMGGSGLDQMEKEYLMALKGEQDNTAVA